MRNTSHLLQFSSSMHPSRVIILKRVVCLTIFITFVAMPYCSILECKNDSRKRNLNNGGVSYHRLKCVSSNVCTFNVKVEQALQNEGFHRNLTYSIAFESDNQRDEYLYKDCILGLHQTVPSGAYANPDELFEFRRTRRLKALPTNRVNIELPAKTSPVSTVYVMGKVKDSKVDLWLPVHARYHHAVSGGGTAKIEIEPPNLYLRCPDQRLDVCDKAVAPSMTFLCNGSSKEKCSWRKIPYTVTTQNMTWHVPVGNLDHYYIVVFGTGIVVVIGSLCLLSTLHEYATLEKNKRH